MLLFFAEESDDWKNLTPPPSHTHAHRNTSPSTWTESDVLSFLEAAGASVTVLSMVQAAHPPASILLAYEDSFLQRELVVNHQEDDARLRGQILHYLQPEGYRPPGVQSARLLRIGESVGVVATTTTTARNGIMRVYWLEGLIDGEAGMAQLMKVVRTKAGWELGGADYLAVSGW